MWNSPWQGQDSKSKKLGFLKKVIITFFPKKIFLITFFNYFMLFITLNKIYLKIVFFNESFDFWKKTKNLKKLPIIQWIIFFIHSTTITSLIDYFIEIILKKIKWNFINFIIILVFLLLIKDIQIRLTVDEWWKNSMKKDWWKKQSEYLTKIKWLIRMI